MIPIVEATTVFLGLPGQGETAGTTTPIATLGEYITWTATVGDANIGKAFDGGRRPATGQVDRLVEANESGRRR